MISAHETSSDPLSKELDAVAHRVCVVQHKRLLVTALSIAVALMIILVGEVVYFTLLYRPHASGRLAFLPLVAGVLGGWWVRQRLWPKDPVI